MDDLNRYHQLTAARAEGDLSVSGTAELARLEALPEFAQPIDPRTRLTEEQNAWLAHMRMWGSNGYPVRKRGSRWVFDRAFGVGGSPSTYRTKREATAACELFYSLLRDYAAGRVANPAKM